LAKIVFRCYDYFALDLVGLAYDCGLCGLEPAAEVGRSLIDHAGSAQTEWAVYYVAVAGDPSDISCASPDITVLDIEDPCEGLSRGDTVSAMDMLDTLGLASGSRGSTG
jgi:hypothetical protein